MTRAEAYIAARVIFEDRGFATPCMIWQLSTTKKGYARADVPEFGRVRVHRAAYEIANGPIPSGLVIDHLCRVTACCNPEHLETVTVAENNRRAGPHRRKSTCKNGHPNTPEHRSASRQCRQCHTEYMKTWREENREKYRAANRKHKARAKEGAC